MAARAGRIAAGPSGMFLGGKDVPGGVRGQSSGSSTGAISS